MSYRRSSPDPRVAPTRSVGRRAVRSNALKHGLAAHTVVALGEGADDFRNKADAHRAAFRPRSDVELDLVKTFTVAAWVRDGCVMRVVKIIDVGSASLEQPD